MLNSAVCKTNLYIVYSLYCLPCWRILCAINECSQKKSEVWSHLRLLLFPFKFQGKVVTRTRNLSLVQRKMSPEVNGKGGRSIRASRIRVKEPSNGGEELRVKSPRTSDGEELATSSGMMF